MPEFPELHLKHVLALSVTNLTVVHHFWSTFNAHNFVETFSVGYFGANLQNPPPGCFL
jgi:hypothetical protein